MKNRVLITGVGTICGLGSSTKEFWSSLSGGRSAIGPLPTRDRGTKISIGSKVTGFHPDTHFAQEDLALLDRFSQFAIVAAREAVADAGLDTSSGAFLTAGAIIGTGCGGKQTDEETYATLYKQGRSRAHPLTIPRGMPSAAASMISKDLNIRGPVFSVASACASGAHAIIQGYLMIKAGVLDVALVGGTDAPFTYGLLKAWEALRVVSHDTCRPFSRDRSGIVLGEGAGILVLESEEHALRRGARPYAELAGCGMTADAGHITRPDIKGIVNAISGALLDAGIPPQAVNYVNAHGTATPANDVVETEALHQVFGSHAKRLAVSSTKSMHGHALGASSALEVIATVLAVKHALAPPTANFTEAGDGCDLDYVPNTARPIQAHFAISNAFAFGGLNAVTVVRSLEPT